MLPHGDRQPCKFPGLVISNVFLRVRKDHNGQIKSYKQYKFYQIWKINNHLKQVASYVKLFAISHQLSA
jgi:hypothetical protein